MQPTGECRGHVRNAFKQLAAEGYVQIEHNKGASIRKLTRAEVVQMYQLREILEGLAGRLAAQAKLTAKQKNQLKKYQPQMDKAEEEVQPLHFRRFNLEYHILIQEMSGNQILIDHLKQLRLPLQHVQSRRFFDFKDMAHSNADHRLITQAILDGDAIIAEKTMRKHVCDGLKWVQNIEDRYFA